MSTTAYARAHLSSGHQTVQTVLLSIITFVGTRLSSLPSAVASVWRPMPPRRRCDGGIVACLWLTSWRGLQGVIFERNLLGGFLVLMPLVYVARYLYAATGGGANFWFWVELLDTAIFVALAVLGVKRSRGSLPSEWTSRISLGCLALSELGLHPRLVHHRLPCGGTSPSERIVLVARVPAYQRASRIEKYS